MRSHHAGLGFYGPPTDADVKPGAESAKACGFRERSANIQGRKGPFTAWPQVKT
jgi:hypothetical protein